MAKDIPSVGADATDVMIRIINEKLDERTAEIMEVIETRLQAQATATGTNMDAMGKGIEADLLAIRETIKDFTEQVREDAMEANRIDKQDMLDYVNRALADLVVDSDRKGGDSREDLMKWVDRRIHQFIDEYHIRRITKSIEDDEDVDDEDVETLKRIFQKYPKSFIWMVSGVLLGMGIGHLFAVVGAWGSLLAIGWLLKSIADNNEKSKKRDPWRI